MLRSWLAAGMPAASLPHLTYTHLTSPHPPTLPTTQVRMVHESLAAGLRHGAYDRRRSVPPPTAGGAQAAALK